MCFFPSNRTQRNSACMLWMSPERRALVIRRILTTHKHQAPHTHAHTHTHTHTHTLRNKWMLSLYSIYMCVCVCVCFSSGAPFTEANSSLSLWEASVGSSYMCNKEQNNTITGLLSIYTFDLHVQPFGVKKDSFSTGRFFFHVSSNTVHWPGAEQTVSNVESAGSRCSSRWLETWWGRWFSCCVLNCSFAPLTNTFWFNQKSNLVFYHL